MSGHDRPINITFDPLASSPARVAVTLTFAPGATVEQVEAWMAKLADRGIIDSVRSSSPRTFNPNHTSAELYFP